MLYSYISPFIILTAIFIATLFIIDWLAKLLIYTLILNVFIMLGYLLYKEEVRQKSFQSQQQEETNDDESKPDSH